ncbi:unnamed protein product, partial [Ceratitis capitata]
PSVCVVATPTSTCYPVFTLGNCVNHVSYALKKPRGTTHIPASAVTLFATTSPEGL